MRSLKYHLLICAAVASAGSDLSAQEIVPAVTNLGTVGSTAWSTNQPPTVAVSDSGVIYVLWPREAQVKSPSPEGLPQVPDALAFGAVDDAESGRVPAVRMYRNRTWLQAGLLVEGMKKECDPLFAWCAGEKLNLLIAGPMHKCRHLVYDPENDRWTTVADLACAAAADAPFRKVGDHIHFASIAGQTVNYLHFDGSSWSKPVKIATGTNDLPSAASIRLAVDGQGAAHIAWWGADSGQGAHGHATVHDGVATSGLLKFEKTPIYKDEFDLGADPQGHVLLAYKAKLSIGDSDERKVHVRRLENGNWSEPEKIGGRAKALLGSIRMIGNDQKVLMTWMTREETKLGKGSLESSVRQLAISDGKTWSSPRHMAHAENQLIGNGLPVGPSQIGMYVDKKGDVHAVWGSPEAFYCQPAQLVNSIARRSR